MPGRGWRKDKTIFKCEDCDYSTFRVGYLEDHRRVHTGDRPFVCQICGKGFTQKSNLGQHLKTHGAGDPTVFSCDKCDFTTKWKTSLIIHERWHTGEKPYKCDYCDKSFSQSTHCRSHIREAHQEVRRYQCDRCSKCFKRQDHLNRHQLFHEMDKKYPCDICGKMFIELSGVRQHRRIHLGEEGKSYQCDQCPYKSFFKQCLDVHYRIHTGSKPYNCDECGKSFRTSSSVKLHTRMIHQGLAGKIFKCDQCEFATANKQSLKLHTKRVHLGIKDHFNVTCKYCHRTYMSKSAYYTHRRKRHGEQWIKEAGKRGRRANSVKENTKTKKANSKPSDKSMVTRRSQRQRKPVKREIYYAESDVGSDPETEEKTEDKEDETHMTSIKVNKEKAVGNKKETGTKENAMKKVKPKVVVKRSVAKKRTGNHTKCAPKFTPTALNRLDSGIDDLEEEEPPAEEIVPSDKALDLTIKKEVIEPHPDEANAGLSNYTIKGSSHAPPKVIGQIITSPAKKAPQKFFEFTPSDRVPSTQQMNTVVTSLTSNSSVTDIITNHLRNVSKGKDNIFLHIPNITVMKSAQVKSQNLKSMKVSPKLGSANNSSPRSNLMTTVQSMSPKHASPKPKKNQPTARKKTGKSSIVGKGSASNINAAKIPRSLSDELILQNSYSPMIITDNAITGAEKPLQKSTTGSNLYNQSNVLPPGDSTRLENKRSKCSRPSLQGIITTLRGKSREDCLIVTRDHETCVGDRIDSDIQTTQENDEECPLRISHVQSMACTSGARASRQTDPIMIVEDSSDGNQYAGADCVVLGETIDKKLGNKAAEVPVNLTRKDNREYNSLRDLACFYLGK